MLRLLFLAGLCSVLFGNEPLRTVTTRQGSDSAVSQYLVSLPHIAYGGGFRTKIIVRNTSSSSAEVTLNYFGDSGAPLLVPFQGVLSNHTTFTVPPNGTREVEPDWTGPESAGWAGIIYSNSGIKIQGVFLWRNPDDPPGKYTEATAPVVSLSGAGCIIPLPASAMTMPYDETEGRFSGYGFTNTTDTAVTMTLTFFDDAGRTVGEYTQQLPAFGHVQFLLRDKVPDVANKKGSMRLSGNGIVPLGFRFTQFFTFTTWLP